MSIEHLEKLVLEHDRDLKELRAQLERQDVLLSKITKRNESLRIFAVKCGKKINLLLSEREKLMSTLADLNTAIAGLTTATGSLTTAVSGIQPTDFTTQIAAVTTATAAVNAAVTALTPAPVTPPATA